MYSRGKKRTQTFSLFFFLVGWVTCEDSDRGATSLAGVVASYHPKYAVGAALSRRALGHTCKYIAVVLSWLVKTSKAREELSSGLD